MVFPSLGNNHHVFVSVSIGFPINSKWDALFQCIAYECFRADWYYLRDHLRDSQWKDIFKHSASAAGSKFFEWIQVGIDVYISHCK